jgi:hypothetical protein
MAYPLLFEEDLSESRIGGLEARVAALEQALARLAPGAAPAPLVITQKLPALKPQADAQSRASLDRLGITGAFDALDLRVAEEAAAQASLGRHAPLDLPEIEIDPDLIDKAFARPAPQKIEVRCMLEELYPRIMERLAGTWRTPELLQYLKRLIVDERGDRAGFSAAAMSELLMLSAVLEAPVEADTWNANARVM